MTASLIVLARIVVFVGLLVGAIYRGGAFFDATTAFAALLILVERYGSAGERTATRGDDDLDAALESSRRARAAAEGDR